MAELYVILSTTRRAVRAVPGEEIRHARDLLTRPDNTVSSHGPDGSGGHRHLAG
jgi:hypothetical protein